MTRHPDTNSSTRKKWLIVSWRHIDHLDDAYGALLETVDGTREDAEQEARNWIPKYSPVGIVEEIA